LTCWRITDSSVVFEVMTLLSANCMSIYSPFRSLSFLVDGDTNVYVIDASTGATVARVTISDLMDLHCASSTIIFVITTSMPGSVML
jgi:hypothetical protein